MVDVKARLVAELHLALATRSPYTHAVEIVVDGTPPSFELRAEPGLVVKSGEPLLLVARKVQDLGGVEKFTFGIDRDGSGDFNDPEKPLVVFEPDLEGNWSAQLETKDLLAPGSRVAKSFLRWPSPATRPATRRPRSRSP